MASLLITIFTILLVLISLFIVLIILMQRASSNSGLGTAMGGGAAESAFGAGTTNVLTRGTIYATVLFFIIGFGLYLGYMAREHQAPTAVGLPRFENPEAEDIAIDVEIPNIGIETTEIGENAEVTEATVEATRPAPTAQEAAQSTEPEQPMTSVSGQAQPPAASGELESAVAAPSSEEEPQ